MTDMRDLAQVSCKSVGWLQAATSFRGTFGLSHSPHYYQCLWICFSFKSTIQQTESNNNPITPRSRIVYLCGATWDNSLYSTTLGLELHIPGPDCTMAQGTQHFSPSIGLRKQFKTVNLPLIGTVIYKEYPWTLMRLDKWQEGWGPLRTVSHYK
jgi:hypothetical protein